GLTGFHDFDGISSTLGWNDLREADRQHIRVTQYLRGNEVPWAIETGWRTGDGDDWLRRGGLKLFSDGALGSHTSHMSSPFPEPEPAPETPAGAGAGADGVVPGGDALADGVAPGGDALAEGVAPGGDALAEGVAPGGDALAEGVAPGGDALADGV